MIIAPYLITTKQLDYNTSFEIINDWLHNKCARLISLKDRPQFISVRTFKDWVANSRLDKNTIPKSQNWNFQNAPGVKYVPEDCSYLQNPTNPMFFLPDVGAERRSVATMTCTTDSQIQKSS